VLARDFLSRCTVGHGRNRQAIGAGGHPGMTRERAQIGEQH
jgi:hypothetical protein